MPWCLLDWLTPCVQSWSSCYHRTHSDRPSLSWVFRSIWTSKSEGWERGNSPRWLRVNSNFQKFLEPEGVGSGGSQKQVHSCWVAQSSSINIPHRDTSVPETWIPGVTQQPRKQMWHWLSVLWESLPEFPLSCHLVSLEKTISKQWVWASVPHSVLWGCGLPHRLFRLDEMQPRCTPLKITYLPPLGRSGCLEHVAGIPRKENHF